MARYEFKIEIPVYLPQEAVDQIKNDVESYMKDLAGQCGEYEVDVKVGMKMETGKKEAEEEESGKEGEEGEEEEEEET
jgi:hypothetical protein